MARWTLAAWKRLRLRALFLRVIIYGCLTVTLLALTGWLAVRLLVKPEDLRRLLISQVAEQTGGELKVGRVTFDVLTGIKLEAVAFHPPLPADPRGIDAGGPVTAEPVVEFDALEIGYSIPRMLAGRLHLTALRLHRPRVKLAQQDGVLSTDGILAYRAARFPAPEAVPVQEVPPETEPTDGKGGGLLPFSPALLYMPVEIMAQNIGISDLEVEFARSEGGQDTLALKMNGVSFDLGVHWFGRTSTMWFNLLSPFERPLTVDLKVAEKDGTGTSAMRQQLSLRSALSMRASLDDLKKVGFDFAVRIVNLETAVAGFQDVGAYVRLRAAANDRYDGIVVEDLDVDLADAVLYELTGSAGLVNGGTEQVDLKLYQKFNLDLANAARLAQPFAPDLKADGQINFDDFRVEGVIEPAKIGDFAGGFKLPFVSGTLWLEELWVDYPPVAFGMEPVSGDVSIAVGPALTGSGAQVDLAVDMDVPMIETTQKGPAGPLTAGVDLLSAKVMARALWPEMVAPVMKVNLEAERVRAKGKGLADFSVPMYLDLDADGQADLAKASTAVSFELTNLAEVSLMADCQVRCGRLRANLFTRLESLEKINAIAAPVATALGHGKFMPTRLTGSLDMQLAARGQMKDPLATPVPELLRTADVRFNTQVALSRVNASVPMFNTELKNFEQRLYVNGSTSQQKIDLAQKFESLTLVVPPSPEAADGKPLAVEVKKWDVGLAVENDIDGELDLETLLSKLRTSAEGWVYFGKADVAGVLPQPVEDFQLEYAASQARLSEFHLGKLDLRLPTAGTTVSVNADAEVDQEFFPRKARLELTTKINHTGAEKLPIPIKTSGQMTVRLGVATEDMRTLAVSGLLDFDRFFVTIPGAAEGDAPKLLVEDIRGRIPFAQSIQLPDLKKLMEAKAAAAKDSGKSAAADQSVAVATPQEVDPLADLPIVGGEGAALAPADQSLTTAMGNYFRKHAEKSGASTNSASVVDYSSVRPFYPERRPLSIRKIDVANLEASRMEFDLELRQDQFSLNQFVIGFLGGKIQGDLQLAFNSAVLGRFIDSKPDPLEIPRKLRLTVHMTRLDTRRLIERFPNLKGKAGGSGLFTNPYIDGTVHLDFDLKTSDLDGGVEITSIGKDQMRMVLYYVDPFEQNPTISDIRKALTFGDVRQVSIPFRNGEIGMDVDVRVLGAPLPTPKLTRFPITQIIQNFRDQSTSGKPPDAKPTGGTPAVEEEKPPAPLPGAAAG